MTEPLNLNPFRDDTVTADIDYATDVARLAATVAQIRELTEFADGLKQRIRRLGLGEWVFGATTVIISPQHRFDPKKAAATLPQPLLEMCLEQVVSAKKAKEALPPSVYAACQSEAGEPRVALR